MATRNFETEIPKGDWLKVETDTFGPDAAKAYEAMKEAQDVAKNARQHWESLVAEALVNSGHLTPGRLPIFSRFGQLADPSKHSKASNTTSTGKKVFTLGNTAPVARLIKGKGK